MLGLPSSYRKDVIVCLSQAMEIYLTLGYDGIGIAPHEGQDPCHSQTTGRRSTGTYMKEGRKEGKKEGRKEGRDSK